MSEPENPWMLGAAGIGLAAAGGGAAIALRRAGGKQGPPKSPAEAVAIGQMMALALAELAEHEKGHVFPYSRDQRRKRLIQSVEAKLFAAKMKTPANLQDLVNAACP